MCFHLEKDLAAKKERPILNEGALSQKDKEKLRFKLRKIDEDIEALKTEGGNFSKVERKNILKILKKLNDERTQMILDFIESMKEKNEENLDIWKERKENLEKELELRDQKEEDNKRKMKETELKSRKQIV